MNCYFYSIQKGLVGLINYRLIKNSLTTDKKQLLENLKNEGVTKGYIYTCRQIEGQFFNNAYKTSHPVEIIGCEKMENLI